MTQPSSLLRLYIDADVIFRAATASHPQTAALVVFAMADSTLCETISTQQTMEEARRNLQVYQPDAVIDLDNLVQQSLTVVSTPPAPLVLALADQAHPKDVANLAAAIHAQAHMLVTYNVRDYEPDQRLIQILTPGDLVQRSRLALFQLALLAGEP